MTTTPEPTPDLTTRWLDPQEFRNGVFGLTISDDEMSAVAHLIRKAEARLVARVPRLEARVASGAVSEDLVKGVVEDMVLRTVRNPEGLASDGAGGVTSSYFKAAASGTVDVLREDLELLMPPQTQVGSIRIGVPSWRIP